MKQTIPSTQYAVQLVGPDALTLNTNKPVFRPGPTQMLLKMEAVGLCFSDLKLLKQFSRHVRKGPVVRGIAPEVLREIPGYVPGEAPTVPGHEAVGRIVAVGEKVVRHRLGERVLVQADWRELRTADSNGAFGYNFEGALQEYVLLDERVVIDPASGERYLLPVGEECGASAIALVEPWGCVEDSYVARERQGPRVGGAMLVVAEAGHAVRGLAEAVAAGGGPASITAWCAEESQRASLRESGPAVSFVESIEALPNEAFDDIVYFGVNPAVVEALNDKLAQRGLFNVVAGGKTFSRPVSLDVGRVHYGQTRWCGTTGDSAAESYRYIPRTGEIRDGERMLIVGAAGPMGQMHVIRNICAGKRNITLTATDFDSARLASLRRKVASLAEQRGVELRLVHPKETPLRDRFTYVALMAPVPALVTQAVADSDEGGIINIFAGIPAGTRAEIDLNAYLARRLWMFGTSGSTIEDMRLVLEKVESGQLDTNFSVDAVSGLAGAIDGIRAVENRSIPGKILVYPALRDLPLTPLEKLAETHPSVAARLENDRWTLAAERELLRASRAVLPLRRTKRKAESRPQSAGPKISGKTRKGQTMKKPPLQTIASQPSWILRSRTVELAITRLGGHMAPVKFFCDTNSPVQPYYISPWQGEGLKIDDPVLVPLRGDFFCAPFGANDEPYRGEQHRCHGEPAHAPWRFVRMENRDGAVSLTLDMRTKVRPGRITKILTLRDDQNAVYSTHILEGYSGPMPLGHHATLAPRPVEGSLRVTTSPFALGMTCPERFCDPAKGSYQSFAVGAKFRDLRKVPLQFRDAAPADCTRFPARTGYTDLLAVYKKPSDLPAWTAAVDAEEGYLWFALKDSALLPATLFWIANRGRHMPPWNGRNLCLGLEDVCANFAFGLARSAGANPIRKMGFPTAVSLSPRKPTCVPYIQGAVRVPRNFGAVADVRYEKNRVVFLAENGKRVSAPVYWEFLRTGIPEATGR